MITTKMDNLNAKKNSFIILNVEMIALMDFLEISKVKV